LTRTNDELAERFKEPGGMFGFHRDVLFEYMPWEAVKDSLKEEFVAKVEAGEEKWEPLPMIRELVLADAKEYTAFAWGKAMNHRGLSASRSINKLQAWCWLLNDDEALKIVNDDDLYGPYGVPILLRVSKHFGWDVPEGSEGTAGGGTVGRMMDGMPCSDSCGECMG